MKKWFIGHWGLNVSYASLFTLYLMKQTWCSLLKAHVSSNLAVKFPCKIQTVSWFIFKRIWKNKIYRICIAHKHEMVSLIWGLRAKLWKNERKIKKGQTFNRTKRTEKSWASTFTYMYKWSLIFSWKSESEEWMYVTLLLICML